MSEPRQCRCDEIPSSGNRGDADSFVGRMWMLQIRADGNHIHVRIVFLDNAAFKAGVHDAYFRIFSEQVFIRSLHDFQHIDIPACFSMFHNNTDMYFVFLQHLGG